MLWNSICDSIETLAKSSSEVVVEYFRSRLMSLLSESPTDLHSSYAVSVTLESHTEMKMQKLRVVYASMESAPDHRGAKP